MVKVKQTVPTDLDRFGVGTAAALAMLLVIALSSAPERAHAAPGAAVGLETGEPAQGEVVIIDVPAPALEGNLLGSPTVQKAAVYLPPSYARQTAGRYPVIYLLHGIFDRHDVWLDGFGVPAILDRLIAGGAMQEAIVVMPDGVNRFGGGFYRNSPVSGNWADFVAEDLVGYVDDSYRTLDRRESRAVTGHSMGGYGALHLGMTRSDVFSVVWAMSPCCLDAVDDLGFGNDAWRRAMQFDTPQEAQVALQDGDFYPVAAIGVLTAFSPDPNAPPLYVEFPFRVVRGETVLIDAVYDRYLDRLPVRRVADHRDDLRSLRGLALDVGLGDQFLHIPRGAIELSRRLGEQRIPHLLDVYEGDHRQLVGQRLATTVFPWVAARLVGRAE